MLDSTFGAQRVDLEKVGFLTLVVEEVGFLDLVL